MLFEETKIVQNLFYKTKYLVKVKPYVHFTIPPLASSSKMKIDGRDMVKKLTTFFRLFVVYFCLENTENWENHLKTFFFFWKTTKI